MMYRPCWVEDCEGTSKALAYSADGSVMVTGSEDGYVFIWDTVTGYPVGGKTPKTKHTSPVSWNNQG